MAFAGLAFAPQGYSDAADAEARRRYLQAQLAAQNNQLAALAALGNTGDIGAPPGTESIPGMQQPQGPVPPTSLVGQQPPVARLPDDTVLPSFSRLGVPGAGTLPGMPAGVAGPIRSGTLTGSGPTFLSQFAPGSVTAAIPPTNQFSPPVPPTGSGQPPPPVSPQDGGGGTPPQGYIQPGYPEMVARARAQLAEQMRTRVAGQPPQPPTPPQTQGTGELPPEISVPRAQGNQPQTWQGIIAQIRRSNPNAPPEVIAEAAIKAVPLMSMLSREQQQAVMNQLRGVQQEIALERLQLLQSRQTSGEVNAWADKVEDYQSSLRTVPAQIRSQVVEELGNRKSAEYKGEQGFAAYKDYTTPNSKTNMTNKSLMTIEQHLDVWKALAQAVKNRDSPLANSVVNWVRNNVFGAGAITSVNQAKEYLASEMVKAVQGAAGTGAERLNLAVNFGPNSSPESILSNYDTAKKYIQGQRNTQKQQYEKLTGRKDYEQLFEVPKYEAAPASTPDGGIIKYDAQGNRQSSAEPSTLSKVASYLNPVGSAQAGEFPPGKTAPSKFLDYERRPAELQGGAPLARTPVKKAESGRATQTKPLGIGKEEAILEAGAENLAQGPTAQELLKLEKVVERNSFPGDALHTEFSNIISAVRSGMPFRQAMLKYGTEDTLQGIERVLKKNRSQWGLGWPEDLPFTRE